MKKTYIRSNGDDRHIPKQLSLFILVFFLFYFILFFFNFCALFCVSFIFFFSLVSNNKLHNKYKFTHALDFLLTQLFHFLKCVTFFFSLSIFRHFYFLYSLSDDEILTFIFPLFKNFFFLRCHK